MRSLLLNNQLATDVVVVEESHGEKTTELVEVSGVVRAAKLPKYLQSGQAQEIRKGEYYLVLHLQK